jgi:hypothetical protein
MTKLNDRQSLNLSVLDAASVRFHDARRSIETDVRREVAARLAHIREARNEAALLASESGVPLSQIGQIGMGTKNSETVRLALEEARRSRAELAIVANSEHQFHLGDDAHEILVVLIGRSLAEATSEFGWSAAEAMSAGVDRATMKVVGGLEGSEPTLIAVSSSFHVGAQKGHPIVFWSRANSPEILTWWKGASE